MFTNENFCSLFRLLTPEEIKEYCGLIRTDDLLGGLWVPGRINCRNAPDIGRIIRPVTGFGLLDIRPDTGYLKIAGYPANMKT
jgi:hypothetical protein